MVSLPGVLRRPGLAKRTGLVLGSGQKTRNPEKERDARTRLVGLRRGLRIDIIELGLP